MKLVAIITAAGSGTRLGANMPKALVPLAGEPLLSHAVRGMREAGVEHIVVTTPRDGSTDEAFAAALEAAGYCDVVMTPGGRTRQESVAYGLAAAVTHIPDATHVLVHDAARALTPSLMIRRVIGLLEVGARAVIPVLPVVDTIKQIEPDSDAVAAAQLVGDAAASPAYTEKVICTVDRAELRAVQTPQGFDVALLKQAHDAGAVLSADEQAAAPDDAALVERLGEEVRTVPGDSRAIKITTQFDLRVAELLCEQHG